jgi:hypothetical protein
VKTYLSIVGVLSVAIVLSGIQKARADAGFDAFDRNGNPTYHYAPRLIVTAVDACVDANGNITAVLLPELESWGELKCNPNETFQRLLATSPKLASWRDELAQQSELLDTLSP